MSTDINNALLKTKKIYEDIFKKSYDGLHQELIKSRPYFLCQDCNGDCSFKEISYYNTFPNDCPYRNWQKNVLEDLKTKISKDIYEKIQEIDKKRSNYECYKCTVCCKFACSEFSYEELKSKSQNGDDFATQFTKIFLPYENDKQARLVFPDYYDLVKNKHKNENVYFYYCPKLSDEGLCSDYENRPQICRDFPNNPLSILPKTCGFLKWHEEVEIIALMLYSLVEIVEYDITKIENALKN